MADRIVISFDDAMVRDFLTNSVNILRPASAAAINRALTAGRAELAKITRTQYNIKSSEVRSKGRIKRASPRSGNPEGSVSFSDRPLSLDRFSKGRLQRPEGIKISVKRGSNHLLKKAFRLNGIEGQLFQRQGGRLRVRKTTAIASLLNSNIDAVRARIIDTLERRIKAEIEGRLARRR